MKNRRTFLKIAGVGLTGSLIQPVTTSAKNVSIANRTIKIGVLLPQSNAHPQYPESFIQGIRLGFKQGDNVQTELITEQVKFGSPHLVKRKIQQLKTENNIDVAIALVNTEVGLEIDQLTKELKLPVLIANAGENYPVKKLKDNPYLFFNTLNLFQNAYLSGEYAVKNFGKEIAVITSQYDSGYDALFSFYKGVENAGGNEVETFIKKEEEFDFISKTLDRIEKSAYEAIYVYLNGNEADEFFRQAKSRNLKLPILTTSFATEESRLLNLGDLADNLLSFGSWNKNLSNSENQKFVKNYQSKYFSNPDQFGFLGFESGQLIQKALQNCTNNFSGKNIASSISACRFNSPGGEIAVNHKTGYVQNPVYLSRCKKSFSSIFTNKVIGKYTPTSETNKTFKSLDADLHSGNSAPYLFV